MVEAHPSAPQTRSQVKLIWIKALSSQGSHCHLLSLFHVPGTVLSTTPRITSSEPHNNPMKQACLGAYFIDEEMEALEVK